LGLFLLMWGGNFVLTVAAVEAFKIVGFTKIKDDLIILYHSLRDVHIALSDDDEEAKKNPPKPPVKVLNRTSTTQPTGSTVRNRQEHFGRTNQDHAETANQIVANLGATVLEAALPQSSTKGKSSSNPSKIRKVLGSVDPQLVSRATTDLLTGMVAVVATLQSQFIQALTIGCSLGDMVLNPCKTILEEKIKHLLPPDLKKWASPFLFYTCRTIGIIVAIMLRKTILTASLCTRSAELILSGLQDRNILPKKESKMTSIFVMVIAFGGVAKQVLLGSSLPAILWILFTPFFFLELFFYTIAIFRIF